MKLAREIKLGAVVVLVGITAALWYWDADVEAELQAIEDKAISLRERRSALMQLGDMSSALRRQAIEKFGVVAASDAETAVKVLRGAVADVCRETGFMVEDFHATEANGGRVVRRLMAEVKLNGQLNRLEELLIALASRRPLTIVRGLTALEGAGGPHANLPEQRGALTLSLDAYFMAR